MSTSPSGLVAAAVVVALGALVQGSAGFGAALVAAPLVTVIDPGLVPAPLFVGLVPVTIGAWVRERHRVDWPVVWWATLGRVPGSALGAVVLAVASDRALSMLVAIVILGAVAASAAGTRPGDGPGVLTGAGVLSGFGSVVAAVGGPPVAIALAHRVGPVVRATLAAFFVVGLVTTLPAMALAGRLGGEELRTGFVLAPAALAGLAASGPLRPLVDAGRVRPVVLTLSAAAAVVVVVRAVGAGP